MHILDLDAQGAAGVAQSGNLTGQRAPDLVVSGVNRGLNIGDDVTYSGTVSGALEGTLLNIPSLAFSMERTEEEATDYSTCARFAETLARHVLTRGLPPGVFLNVNFPASEPRGVRITKQGNRSYKAAVVERLDPSGRPYFWIAGADTTPAEESDDDSVAIKEGFVSVTPLHANLTHVSFIAALAEWGLELP